MINLKKLIFAPLFLISFTYLCYQINPFISSTDAFFSLTLDGLFKPIILAGLVLITSYFFVLFATLAQDWVLVGITALIAGILPIIFLPAPLSLYFAVGSILSLVIIFAVLLNKLKTYLNFQPSILLSPSIRNLSTLLALIIAILYFLSISTTISQKGFELPDSLLNTITSLSSTSELDALTNNVQNSNQDLVKNMLKSEIQNKIKPYESFIAPTLAILIFFSLTSSISLLALISPIILWATFSFLKTTGFIKFQTEMREVKKLII